MCLGLVNINSGFQEPIHSLSLKQESLCLSLPSPYCFHTIFISFLPDKIFLIILFHGIWFFMSLEKTNLFPQLIIVVINCFLVGTRRNKICIFTIKCRKLFVSILHSSGLGMKLQCTF